MDGHGDTSPSETGDDTVAPQLDMHAVINQIIDHGEHVESQYGVPDEGTAVVFTTSQLKIQSLPILENVVSRILAACPLSRLTPAGGASLDDFRQYLL